MSTNRPIEEIAIDVDNQLAQWLVHQDPRFDEARAFAKESGLPPIEVSRGQGKLLYFLAKLVSAKRILEIGTLGGYSALWMAKALPHDGKLISLEFNPKHAEVARKNFEKFGLEDKIEVKVGAAFDHLPALFNDYGQSFDLAFVDADKRSMPGYFDWCRKLVRSGGLIISDNVVRGGRILDPNEEDPDVKGIQQFLQDAGKAPGIESTVIQTIGAKGYDGYAISLVL